MLQLQDPRQIPQSDEPLIVFANQPGNIISDLIDWRTNIPGLHPWDHAMLSIDKGQFVVQDMAIFNAYKEIPMDRYLTPTGQLCFVQFVNSNPTFIQAFNKSVQKRLTASWWQTQYDYLGIFGQAIGLPWIHTPGLRYCSVDVIRHAVNACPNLPKEDQEIINNIPPETNPETFWKIILAFPQTFYVYGYWTAKPIAAA